MNIDIIYLITPFFAWLFAGSLKFIISSIKARKPALSRIGYGGLPSNHSAIVSNTAILIAPKEGVTNPMFGIAVTVAFIVMLDAASLRKQVGMHAKAINKLSVRNADCLLREIMGHTKTEILAGPYLLVL